MKVLDEDLTTSISPIVAVNMVPATKGGDRFIVGGVHVPAPTTLMPVTSELRDYTRFGPPTAGTGHQGDVYVAPITLTSLASYSTTMPPLPPQGKYNE